MNNLEIEVLEATKDPMYVISTAMSVSYNSDRYSEKRVKRGIEVNHGSILEHASFTVIVDGISRACSHQLVRHRHASFLQQSQRYVKLDGTDWYVTPPKFLEDPDKLTQFIASMEAARIGYDILIGEGAKPEDARFVLPEATKTKITITMNVREFFHFLDLRLDKAAQWEIRNLAKQLLTTMRNRNESWRKLMNIYIEPREIDESTL